MKNLLLLALVSFAISQIMTVSWANETQDAKNSCPAKQQEQKQDKVSTDTDKENVNMLNLEKEKGIKPQCKNEFLTKQIYSF